MDLVKYDTHPNENQIADLCGWRQDDAEVNRILATKSKPTFQSAAPHLTDYWRELGSPDVLLSESCKKVNAGQHLPADKQTIGDCVSHGYARAVDYLYCVKQASGAASGFVEGQTSAMSEAIYGEAREVGHDLSQQDGAVGIWAVEALQQFGFVGRGGKPYDGQLAKQWGARGTPSEFKQAGRVHVLEQYAKAQSTDDLANGLAAGCPAAICTQLGFTMTRDANGVCRVQGKWGHCMAVIGVFSFGGSRYFVILQSWGQNVPDGPVPAGGAAPDNSFGCDDRTMQSILDEGDSFNLAALRGFQPLPPLSWKM